MSRRTAINLIFDGPPGPDGPRFIECEDEDGNSFDVGQWFEESDGTYSVDPEKTAEERKKIYARRKERAVPAREWIEKERERVETGGDIKEPVRVMFRQSMELSESFATEMREFWGLDEKWVMPE